MNKSLIELSKVRLDMHMSFLDKYWTYAVYNSKRELVFIYYGTFKDIIAMRPLRLCENFNEDDLYSYVFLNHFTRKIDAENAVSYWIIHSELEGKTPIYNLHLKLYNNDSYIQCLENGRFYKTSVDVAKIFNVSQSALCNHLRGVAGYKSVKGLHFKRYYGERPKEIELFGGCKLQHNGLGYVTVPSDDPINTKDTYQRDAVLEDLKMRSTATW